MPKLLLAIFVAATAGLAACSGGSGTGSVSVDQRGRVRVLHAAPSAPSFDVRVDGALLIEAVDYRGGTELRLAPGSHDVAIAGVAADDGRFPVAALDLDIDRDDLFDLVAVGTAGGFEPLVLRADRRSLGDDEVRVRVLHAAPKAPAVDVYVTTPGVALSAATRAATLSFRESFGPAVLTDTPTRIRLVPVGSRVPVFDSGALDLEGGADLLIAAVENTGSGDAPVALVVVGGEDGDPIQIPDAGAEAELRVVHASPDAPAVDVLIGESDEPTIRNLEYAAATDFAGIAPGRHRVRVTAAGMPSVVAIDTEVTFEPGESYTALSIDLLSQDRIRLLLLEDDRRAVATEARVRVVHASPSAGDVDVYVVRQGIGIGAVEPSLRGVPFEGVATLSLETGTYEVTVTPTGTKRPEVGPVVIEVQNGSRFTAIVRDAEGTGGPFAVILLADDLGDG